MIPRVTMSPPHRRSACEHLRRACSSVKFVLLMLVVSLCSMSLSCFVPDDTIASADCELTDHSSRHCSLRNTALDVWVPFDAVVVFQETP